MTITAIRSTRLRHRLEEPYVWAQGVNEYATTLLVEVEDDSGHTGIGEGVCAPDPEAVERIVRRLASGFVGRDPFSIDALCRDAYHSCFEAWGASVPRFGNQIVAGLEMALWDLAGKIAERPVHDLLGGRRRSGVDYFYFLQGESAAELAADAARAAAQDAPLVYLKIGRGESTDLAIVAAVREAIGDRRLRLDANEAWDPLTAIRMIRKLERFEPECIEQPTPSGSIAALAQVKAAVGVPIGADQCVYTLDDVYEVCRRNAADLIVLGLHEAGGILNLRKAAAVAEAAGLRMCMHGVFETGITTCATWHAAVTLPNLDDGNQIMWQLLAPDIVARPSLQPVAGHLTLPAGPGFGFALDPAALDAARRAATVSFDDSGSDVHAVPPRPEASPPGKASDSRAVDTE